MEYNVFGLWVRAGFGAQNCQLAMNLNRCTKLHLNIETPISIKSCYVLPFFSFQARQFEV